MPFTVRISQEGTSQQDAYEFHTFRSALVGFRVALDRKHLAVELECSGIVILATYRPNVLGEWEACMAHAPE